MGRDPFAGTATAPTSQHPYTYVSNNPVNRTDPRGLCDEILPDELCWSIFEEIERRYPEALDTFPGLATFPEEELRGILESYNRNGDVYEQHHKQEREKGRICA